MNNHSIHIWYNAYNSAFCSLPLGDNRYLYFKPEDAHLAVTTWINFQKHKQIHGLDSALDKVAEWLDLKPAQA